MTIDFDRLKPLETASAPTTPPEGSVEVPADVLARFKSTKGLGRAVKRELPDFAVRTFGGETVETGERTAKGNKRTKNVGGTVFLVPKV